jgi:cell division protein FtsQ
VPLAGRGRLMFALIGRLGRKPHRSEPRHEPSLDQLMQQRRADPNPELKIKRDPAPTRWSYKYQRLMLTPLFRASVRIGLPVVLVVFITTAWFSNDANRAMLNTKISEWTEAFQNRPSFMVAGMQVDGADSNLTAAILADLKLTFPVSSFDLDLDAIRTAVIAYAAVKDASVGVQPGGTLQIAVTQREPVAVWRYQNDVWLIDADGFTIGLLSARADRGDLPLIAGDGAKDAIGEALALFQAAGPISDRVRGLVRMSERRWDLVLDRDQRILLPHENPIAALQRVMALNEAQDMLDRDILTVDMRNAARPTIRLSDPAVAILRNTSAIQTQVGQ